MRIILDSADEVYCKRPITVNETAIQLNTTLPDALAGQRLDMALAAVWPQFSRTRLKAWLEAGHITVNQQPAKPRYKVLGGETLTLNAPTPTTEHWAAQALPLDIIHEDEAILVINKPPGMVTHPAPGHYDGTLVNALIHHQSALQNLPRAGLIHRLDKDTSGLLVVAKTIEVHHQLVKALQARQIKRHYEAVVKGNLTGGGRIETLMSRDPRERTRMAVSVSGKIAVTHYRVIERFPGFTHISVQLETGRTHQIRVHMAHLRHPIVGDPAYGNKTLPKGVCEPVKLAMMQFKRQALHAKSLGLTHPITNEYCEWEAPLPEDMQKLIAVLKENPHESHSR